MNIQPHCLKHEDYRDYCRSCEAAAIKARNEEEEENEEKVKEAIKKEEEIQKVFLKFQESGRYIYVYGKDARELVIHVNKKIAEGYEPLGSPNITTYTYGEIGGLGGVITSGWSYLQFMSKPKKE